MNQKAFEIFATAHPHEAYAKWPDRFWKFFHKKHPDLTMDDLKFLLSDTEESQVEGVRG
ncbi:MAG: hypothetical protein WCI95_03235 [bacterium]